MRTLVLCLTLLCSGSMLAQIPANGLVAHYPFYGNAKDASGNGNHGTLHNVTLVKSRFGTPDHAFHFNGTNSFIEVPHSQSLAFTTGVTTSAWIRLDPATPKYGNTIINKGVDDPSYITGDWTMVIYNVDNQGMRNRPHVWASNTQQYYDGTNVLGAGTWHHIVMTYDGTTLASYVDGQKDGSRAVSGPLRVTASTLRIGVYDVNGAPAWFAGDIDDILVYNRALTEVEIGKVYDMGVAELTVAVQDVEHWGPLRSTGEVTLYNHAGGILGIRPTEQNGTASFQEIPGGVDNYYTVYDTKSTPVGTAYWGRRSGLTMAPGGSVSETFVRNMPYAKSVRVFEQGSGIEVTGDTVLWGTPLRVVLRVAHENNSGSTQAQVGGNVILDRSQSAPFDFSSTLSATRTIAPGGSPVDLEFFYTPQDTGVFRYSVAATSLVDGATRNTDATGWSVPLFIANGVPPVPPPTITAVMPGSGKPGAAVTITGMRFSSNPASNIVYFGAVRAQVTAASATSLTVTVPAGATYAPVTVLVNGSIAYSAAPFMPTFDGSTDPADMSFSAKAGMAPGAAYRWGAIADLDGDGKPDLVGTNNNNTVSVFRNAGVPGSLSAGSFETMQSFAVGSRPYYVKAADLNGDGRFDLAAIANSSVVVSILKNTGGQQSISFDRQDIFVPSATQGIAMQDLDGDGRVDIVTSGGGISVLPNTGNAGNISFGSRIDLPTSGGGFLHVIVADIDGDKQPDIIAAKRPFSATTGLVSVFRNISQTGAIQFAASVDFVTGFNPQGVAAGDLDGDGKLDVVVSTVAGTTGVPDLVSVLRNTSSPGSISFAARVDLPQLIYGAWKVELADLNGDGSLDIALPIDYAALSVVSLFCNTSTPGQISFAPRRDLSTLGEGTYEVNIGDLDLDGKPDLMVAALYNPANGMGLHRNTTTKNSAAIPVSLPARTVTKGTSVEIPLTAGDLTGRGILSYQFTVRFNSPQTFLTIQKDLLLSGTLSAQSGWSVVANTDTLNQITVGAFGATPLTGGGPLVILKGQVSANALEGQQTNLLLTAFTFNAGTPGAAVSNGTLRVSAFSCGDADGNGLVQAYDASLTLRDAIGIQPLPTQGKANADVDLNSQIQAYDAALILRKSIGLAMPAGVSTCFAGLSRGESTDDMPGMLNAGLTGAAARNGHTIVQLRFPGQDIAGLLSLAMTLEFPGAGEKDCMVRPVGLPDEYLCVMHQPGAGKFAIALVHPRGISMRDIVLDVEVTKASLIRGMRISSVLANATSLPDIDLSGDAAHAMPQTFALVNGYPNPFNPSTTVVFDVPAQSAVTIEVYNILGLRIRTLVRDVLAQGRHEAMWDGKNDDGQVVSSGQYFCRMKAEGFVGSIRLMLLK